MKQLFLFFKKEYIDLEVSIYSNFFFLIGSIVNELKCVKENLRKKKIQNFY